MDYLEKYEPFYDKADSDYSGGASPEFVELAEEGSLSMDLRLDREVLIKPPSLGERLIRWIDNSKTRGSRRHL
jgi:hypothetical protein